jgi:N-acetylmuramoyl-L-alanine amidase
MPEYKVKQGDYLSKIANKHGFSDYQTIWDHPKNSELKKKRQSPNILYTGDVLFIPEKNEKEESGATEQRHRFMVKGHTLMLRIVFKTIDDQPIANEDCELHVGGEVFSLTTDGNGTIEQRIPATAETGRLIFKNSEVPFDWIPIKIGHLDPIEEISGQQARLNNLGYNAGPIDGKESEQLRSAIEEFQCDYFKNISQVDGKCGPNTQAKLKNIHGC